MAHSADDLSLLDTQGDAYARFTRVRFALGYRVQRLRRQDIAHA